MPHAFIAARVARGADLIEQTLRRELRERLKARVDDPLVRVQLVRHWRTRRIPSRTGRQIPVQLARLDPIMDRSTVHPEPPRQLRLRDALLQVVLQQHPDLPSVHLHTFPDLLAKPTSRPGAPSSTSQKVSNFGLAQMGDLQLGLTRQPVDLLPFREVMRRDRTTGGARNRWCTGSLSSAKGYLRRRRRSESRVSQPRGDVCLGRSSHIGRWVPGEALVPKYRSRSSSRAIRPFSILRFDHFGAQWILLLRIQ